MRALLLYNPNATTTTPAVTDVIASALAKEVKLEVEATKRRSHAGYLAAGAAHEGFEAVFALGGDGTINEVIQGLATTAVKLGIIPGGSTNVLARSLGLTGDAVEATATLLRLLREGTERMVSLGRANERFFAVNAGFGFDAEVVRFVEQRYRLKRTVRQASFVYCGLLAYARGYDRRAEISVEVDGGAPPMVLRTAVCCNSNPYSYLGKLPAQLCPEATLDGRLDLLGLTGMALPRMLRLVRTALTSTAVGSLGFTRLWHDRPAYTLASPEPLPLQVDGDFIGEFTTVRLETVPHALTLIA